MKKITLLPILAMAMGFAACDNVDLGTGIPVVNPQLPAAGLDQVTVAPGTEIPAVVNLAQYAENGFDIPVATATAGESWPEGYGFGASVQVSNSENFAKSFTLPCVVVGPTICIDPEELNEGIRENFTKNPVDLTLYLRYTISAVKGKESIVLGGPDTYVCPMSITVLPTSPVYYDYNYYLAYSTTASDFSAANTVAFANASNVYDNPDFSNVFNIAQSAAGIYWLIISQTDLDANNFAGALGVAAGAQNNTSGTCVAGGAPGYLSISGPFEFNFNVENNKYNFRQAIPNFWLAGNGVNGTSWNNGQFAQVMWTQNYIDYVGYAHLYGADKPEFKFSPTNAWSGDFGVSSALNYTNEGGVATGNGKADGSGNIQVPAEGLYYIQLNWTNRNLTITSVNAVGLIGSFNGWGESLALTPSADLLTWTGTFTLAAGDEWKVRMNNAWDINLGGSAGNLVPNGENLKGFAAGTYAVTLNLGTLPYTITLTQQ